MALWNDGYALVDAPEAESETLISLTELKALRNSERAQRKEELEAKISQQSSWPQKIAAQGPWDPVRDSGFSLDGPPSLPMPVKITDTAEFEPFFDHIKANGSYMDAGTRLGEKSNEQAYDVETLEFPRGVLYEDGRMDLCKQVLGPPSLPPLMQALSTNTYITHFLFGNNIIGPSAAKAIASYVSQHDQMETWYLAGNCINASAFHSLVDAWIDAHAVTNIWLKRNPLSPNAVDDIFHLITQTPNLRTLDLDQTSLSNTGVSRLFTKLAEHCQTQLIPLRHLYLNGVGASTSAATRIAAFLATPHCELTSLYLSHNPLGDAGVTALSTGLASNTSLKRLTLSSVGMASGGCTALLNASLKHDGTGLSTLIISPDFATEDLGSRYNWITDGVVPTLTKLVSKSTALRYLDIGHSQLSTAAVNEVHAAFLASPAQRILYLNLKPRPQSQKPAHSELRDKREAGRLSKLVASRLASNVSEVYEGMSYQLWMGKEKRFVVSPRDVRKIGSVYRNRHAALARKGLKVLDKWWEEGNGTLGVVMGQNA